MNEAIDIESNERVSFSKYPEHFEKNLVKLILEDRAFASQMQEVLDVSYFDKDYLKLIVENIFNYKDKYGTHPATDTIDMLFATQLRGVDPIKKAQAVEFWENFKRNRKVEDPEYYMKIALDFCRSEKVLQALSKSVQYLKSNEIDVFMENMTKAASLGSSQNFGHDYFEDFEKRYEKDHREPITTGWAELDAVTKGGLGKGEIFCYVAPPSCHGKGTKVVMFDGTFKNIEDVKIGNLLMGPDSIARTVLKTYEGNDDIYDLKYLPWDNGDCISFTKEHDLALVHIETEEKILIKVKDYLNKSNNWKRYWRMYKPEYINFPNPENVKCPYFLGLLLGDGYLGSIKNPHSINLFSTNEYIFKEAEKYGEEFDCGIRFDYYKNKCPRISFPNKIKGRTKNPIAEWIKQLGLHNKRSGEKFIPKTYLFSSRENRLELLAGLLDTDGYLGTNEYEYCTKSPYLCEDIIVLANSLGFRVRKHIKNINNTTYYRIYIRGKDLEQIPVRILYKKHKTSSFFDNRSDLEFYKLRNKTRVNNLQYYKFVLKKSKETSFFGISVDKDNLYLTSDFTVTKNCGKTARQIFTSCKNLQAGKNVIYFTLEMTEIEIGQRFDSCLSEIHLEKLLENKDEIRKCLEELPGKLRIIEEEYCSTTPRKIFNKVKKLEDTGFTADLVVIDYADVCAPTKSIKDDDGIIGGIHVYQEMKTLAQRYQKRILTAAQTNREGAEADIITPKHFEGRFMRFNPCHFVVGFSKTGKVANLKNRVGPEFLLSEEKDFGRVSSRIYKDIESNTDNATTALSKAKDKKSIQEALGQFLNARGDRK